MTKFTTIILTIMGLASPALAEVNLSDVQSCFERARANQGDPALCINVAQDSCLDNAQETPAVSTLCYHDARDVWSEGLSQTFAEIVPNMDDEDAAVLQIETKYALLGNLLQCDRVEELSLAVSDMSNEEIGLQTARCQASATAATYLRLTQLRLAQTD